VDEIVVRGDVIEIHGVLPGPVGLLESGKVLSRLP
jgi:hypothetical protein